MTRAATFTNLWTTLGCNPTAATAVEFTGPEPVLPSTFPVDAFAAATIAAAALAATEFGKLRGLPSQTISIESGRVAATFRSERYFHQEGVIPENAWEPFSGHYQAGDGRWLQLHTNFPHHRRAALTALGLLQSETTAERKDAEAVIGSRPANEVVEAIVAANGCAALLRQPQEWQAHPQGQSIAKEPLISFEPRTAAAPSSHSALEKGATAPLAGIRILDLTRVLAGPVCGRFLAALGADVLRVGSANLPTFPAVDLRTAAGIAQLRELAAAADVVVEAFRPGSLAALGLGADDLVLRNPSLIHLGIDAWGWTGPWCTRRGYDSLVQTGTGIVAEEWSTAGTTRPTPLPCQALDHGTGYLAAAATSLALAHRETTGQGAKIHLSLAATAQYLSTLERSENAHQISEPDLTSHFMQVPSPQGDYTRVASPATLSHTPLNWHTPPPTPGSATPVWL